MSPRDISPKGQTQERSESHADQSSAPEQLTSRHVIHFVPVSIPSGKYHVVTSGVLPGLLQPGSPESC